MTDSTNQDLNLQNNANQNQLNSDVNPTHITVHQGGHVEGAPISVESSSEIEKYVESSEKEPELSEEEKDAGVDVVRSEPILHPDVQKAGLKHSIPQGPNYDVKASYEDEKSAKVAFEKGNNYSANSFRALMFIKSIQKGLIDMLKPSKT